MHVRSHPASHWSSDMNIWSPAVHKSADVLATFIHRKQKTTPREPPRAQSADLRLIHPEQRLSPAKYLKVPILCFANTNASENSFKQNA